MGYKMHRYHNPSEYGMDEDGTREGWMALILCVYKYYSWKEAFDELSGKKKISRHESDELAEEIDEYRRKGMKWEDISELVGKSVTNAFHIHKRWRIRTNQEQVGDERKNRKRNDKMIAEIKRLREEEKWKWKDIGKELGIHTSTAFEIYKEEILGVKRTTKGFEKGNKDDK